MRRRTLRDVTRAVRGSLRSGTGKDLVVTRVVVDSRKAAPGSVFFALPGERSDGHAFVADAFSRGASGAVVRRGSDAGTGGALVDVPDPARALLDLARDERAAIDGAVVGITGSTGKTSTKDFTAAVLAERFVVAASPASFNNEVGLPLTILEASEDTRAIVCEMGSRGPGHIRLLCEIARPTIGVVTNVGVAHMELFGSPGVLRDAKAELPESLPADGVAVLNADDHIVRSYAARTAARIVLVGAGRDAQVRADQVSLDPEVGAARFRLVTPEGSDDVALTVAGEHMVWNAVAAAGVGWAVGMPVGQVAQGLRGAKVTGGRMEVRRGADGLRIVNDAYNANPTSMAAALRAARWMAGQGRCIVVLGPMAELGSIAREEHLRVGELLVRLGIHSLVAVGEEARLIAAGAEHEGLEPDRIHLVEDPAHAVEVVRILARPGDLVLVKASRAARLERVAEALVVAPGERRGAGDALKGARA
jgi:UDP-N-acetylmuramoyl-tripeptide--D-alanyl-D-alanine ligase